MWVGLTVSNWVNVGAGVWSRNVGEGVTFMVGSEDFQNLSFGWRVADGLRVVSLLEGDVVAVITSGFFRLMVASEVPVCEGAFVLWLSVGLEVESTEGLIEDAIVLEELDEGGPLVLEKEGGRVGSVLAATAETLRRRVDNLNELFVFNKGIAAWSNNLQLMGSR